MLDKKKSTKYYLILIYLILIILHKLIKTFKNKKILVTGHSGFKGSWLALWLSHIGANVCGLSLNPPSNPYHLKTLKIDGLIKDSFFDISNTKKVEDLIKKIQPDFIFHLAAQPIVSRSYKNPIDTWKTNLLGTINILNSLKTLKKNCVAILITSDKCYENNNARHNFKETDKLGGNDPYSASKASTEMAIDSYVKSFFLKNRKIRIGICRAGNVIGGGDWGEDRIVPDCAMSWYKRKKAILRSPESTRPWQHVLEPLSGYLSLAMNLSKSNKLHGQAFNFGPNVKSSYSVKKLVNIMSDSWNNFGWKKNNRKNNYFKRKEDMLLSLNSNKAKKLLGWKSTWNINKTAEETIAWYKNFYQNPNQKMLNNSLDQISRYTVDARKKNIKWAK